MSPPAPQPRLHVLPSDGLAFRSDDALMLLARDGEEAAFELLVHRYLARLTAYCAKFLRDATRGEELAQEVMVDCWRARLRYQPEQRLDTFLFTIARNKCRNWRRRFDARSGAPLDTLRGVADSQQPALEWMIARENERRTLDALQRLRPKLREAVLLRYDAELDYAQIAAIVGRNESTVRSRVFHGLNQLRLLMGVEVEP